MAAPKKVVKVGPRASALAGRMEEAEEQGGGIRAGAHPEFDTDTPLDKTVRAVQGVAKRAKPIVKAALTKARLALGGKR